MAHRSKFVMVLLRRVACAALLAVCVADSEAAEWGQALSDVVDKPLIERAAPALSNPDATEPTSAILEWRGDEASDRTVRQGGDRCGDAVDLSGVLPVSVIGTTVGLADDYDCICPYSGSTAPDVVYSFSSPVDVRVDISLCQAGSITDFDTKLYVYEGSCGDPGAVLACNDDACWTVASDNVSRITDLPLVAGRTYYIVVDGYGSAAGAYQLDISEVPVMPEGSQCPEGYLVGQNWDYAVVTTSDELVGARHYENFAGADQDVCEVHWWGLNIIFVGGVPSVCQKEPDSFEITFYNDEAGSPGTVACGPYEVTPTKINTGVLFASTTYIWEYSAVITPCCSTGGRLGFHRWKEQRRGQLLVHVACLD